MELDVRAYCISCKKKVEVKEGKLVYYKNGTPVEKGKCAECGKGVNRIMTGEERVMLKENSHPLQTSTHTTNS